MKHSQVACLVLGILVCCLLAPGMAMAAGADQSAEFVSEGCCGKYTGGYTGNVDCSPDGELTLNDVIKLISRVYLYPGSELCCPENANVDGSPDGQITLNDVTRLIDAVYNGRPTAPCP